MKTLLAGFGDPNDAAGPLDWARTLADVSSAELYVLSVATPSFAERNPTSWDAREASIEASAEEALERLHDGLPTTTVVADHPRQALIKQANEIEADLLVVAKEEAGGPRGFGLDGPQHWLLHHAGRPVAVVTPNPPNLLTSPVLVGVNGSEANEAAISFAGEIAQSLGTQLLAVCAYDPSLETLRKPHDVQLYANKLQAQMAEITNTPVRMIMHYGDPKEVLCRTATEEQAAVLVVGTKGAVSLNGRLLGTVPTHLMDCSPCPFVVVPH